MKLANLSLRQQFYIAMLSIGILTIIVAFSFNIFSSYSYKMKSFIQESTLQASLIADNSVAPMLFFDAEGTKDNLILLKKYPDILQAVIFNTKEKIFVQYNPQHRTLYLEESTNTKYWFSRKGVKTEAFFSETFIVRQNIELNGIHYGTLYLEKSSAVLREFLEAMVKNIIIFSLLLFTLITLFVIKISSKLITPIVQLSDTLVKLSESSDYSIRLHYEGSNEIARLYGAFNHLFSSIEKHQKLRDVALESAKNYQGHLENLTNELEARVEARTSELQSSLDTLKKAQSQLIESEKMAALGSLVSGVAHEVNTPLGNAITGSSIIKTETKELHQLMQSGSLKKSILEEKLMHLEETSNLLMKSVLTAANLVRSFKQISVDQSIEAKREFNLYDYINEILLTFKNKLKHIPVTPEVVGDKELIIKSYPGSYAQIFNNFIQNSIVHGFENKRDDAKIVIDIYVEDNFLHIAYMDNGSGIDESIKDKAFDPFITTKRNEGGTGLGLNIVYNIVSQKLKGSIKLISPKEGGVMFMLKIPIES